MNSSLLITTTFSNKFHYEELQVVLANISLESYKIKIVIILAFGFALASLLGYLTQRLKLSPILGYLLAGFLIGPFSPGFVANLEISEQLAEIGVILMMFGVGLHFKWEELASVKHIAIPGALGQTFIAVIVGIIFIHQLGWPIQTGLVIGLAIGVASTVVMVRVLADNHLLGTKEGHIAIGWLIVEDLITIIVLLLLPALATSLNGEAFSLQELASTVIFALLKCALLILIIIAVGFRIVSYIFLRIAQTRSEELFTLTVLAIIFGIATGSALLFGTSIALGAFIAGMVIGQTDVRHQASANALPLKDAFAVIFFLSVGMLFNPVAIINHSILFLGILSIILIIKPLTAFIIVRLLKCSNHIAITVAVALSQIGEFSFILSEEALKLKILPEDGYDIIVACALISIAINPLLFKASKKLENFFNKPVETLPALNKTTSSIHDVIVIGFGPIGQAVVQTLEKLGFTPVIIDNDVDTITKLKSSNRAAIYGDASLEHIQKAVFIQNVPLMVITIPQINTTIHCIEVARQLNPHIKIFARANYTSDQILLRELGVHIICSEEETKLAFLNALWNAANFS